MCSNVTFLKLLTCKELTSTMWRIITKFSQMWIIGTESSHVWINGTKYSHLWKTDINSSHVIKMVPNPHTYEEMVPNPHTCEKLVPNHHIYEELALNRHRCQGQNCEELELNAKCSRFGGHLSIWGICMDAIWNLISYVFFTKCEMLVRNMWCFCTIFLRTVKNWNQIYEVWNLRLIIVSTELEYGLYWKKVYMKTLIFSFAQYLLIQYF